MELLVTLAALIAAFALVVLYRHGDRRLAAGAIGILVAGVLVAVSMPSNGANAAGTVALTVTPVGLGAPNRVDLEGRTYAQAKADLTAKSNLPTPAASVVVPIVGLPVLTSTAADLFFADSSTSISMHGPMDMFGNATGELWVVATWPSGSSMDPVVNTFLKFGSISLSDLTPGWPADFPITLGPAILGITDTDNLLEEDGDLETDLLLDDGLPSTANEFDLKAGKLNMQATVSSGPLMDAAGDIGGATGGVRLTGALGASLSLIDEAEDTPSTIGLDLKAEFEVTTPAGFPEWVELTSPWVIDISADSGGTFSARFTGGATVKLDGETEIEVTGSVGVAYEASALTVDMSLEVGTVPNLFGQDWLDLNGAEVHASINSNGDFAGGFSASVTLGPAIAELEVELEVAGGTTSATIDASLVSANPPAGISGAAVLAALGAPTGSINPQLFDLVLNEVSLHVEIVAPPSPDPTEVTVSLFADADLVINGASFPIAALFRLSKGAEPTDFLVAARIDGPQLSDLVPGIPFDWDLPDVAIVASNADREDASADLDGPTFSYFAPTFCEQDEIDADTCEFDLEVTQGIQITALIELPDDLRDQLAELNIEVDGPLVVVGQIPAFGGTVLQLEVFLPAITIDDDGIVESAQVSFFIRKVGTEFTAGISGNMGFRIKRSDIDACSNEPAYDGLVPGGSGECYDVVELEVTAQITSNIDGISIELLGTVSNWDNAFGEPWLDIQTFTLKLGISIGAGGGVSLDLGLLGQLKFGVAPDTKDLTLAIKVSITATPPWVVLQGFTIASYDGIGVKDVARLIGVDASGIPDLALKNLFISFGVTTDVDLCIRQGFFLSAELHINAPSSTGADPACTPAPLTEPGSTALPTDACIASETCVAAIMIDVNTTPGPTFGFTGAAAIAAFDLGPIHIDTTEILLKITTQEQRFRFSGGGYVEDPTGATDDIWAEGSLTIDFSNNGGLVSLYLHGFVEIAGGYILSAEVTANVVADFSQIGSANGFLNFVNSLEFDITVTITSEAWDDFVEDLEAAGETLVSFVDDTEDALDDGYQTVVDFFSGEYCTVFTPAECNNLNSATAATGNASDYINLRANSAYNDIVSTSCVGVICVYDDYVNPFGTYTPVGGSEINCFTSDCNVPYATDVYNQIWDYWDFYGGSEYISIHGVHDVEAYAGSGSTWPSVVFNFLGICENNATYGVGALYGTVSCDGGGYDDDMIRGVVGPIIEANFTGETGGYTLTFGQNGVDAVRALDAALAPGDPPAVVQGRASEAQTVATFQPTCGSTQLLYTPAIPSVAPLTIEFSHPGPGESAAVVPLVNGSIGTTPTIQGVVDTLTTTTTQPECLANQVAPNYGNTTVVQSGSATEGVSYSIQGFANDGAEPPVALSFVTVTIDWGDGSSPETTTTNALGMWSKSHVYADDPGAGPTHVYDVKVRAGTATDDRIVEVVVNNADPVGTATAITFDPAQPDVGEEVDVTFNWTDSGILDSFQLVVDWGDGSPATTVNIAVENQATHSTVLSHTYSQALGIGQEFKLYSITATVTDKDGGVGTLSEDVQVNAVLPPVSKIIAKNADGSTYAPGSWTNQDVTIQVIPSVTDRPPYSTSYGVDNPACGQSWPLGSFCTAYGGPFTVTGDGAHTVIIYSRDSAATEYPVFFPVNIDATPPKVVITPPVLPLGQGGFYSLAQAPITVAITATDISGVAGITCKANNVNNPVTNLTGIGTNTATGITTITNQGTVDVVCVATNGANATGAGPDSVNAKTIKVDTVAPAVTVTGVTNGGSYVLGTFTPGCTTTDVAPGSGVATNATLSTTGGNGMGAGSVTATCSGGKDVAGNVKPPVSATYTVTCAPTAKYSGIVNVKQGTITYKPTVTVTLAVNPATCAVTAATLVSSANVPGALQANTAVNWKVPTNPVLNQWNFAMKTVNAATGGVYVNNQYRALDGTSNMLIKLLNNRTNLYMKLTGKVPIGVGTTTVTIEAEVQLMNKIP